MSSTNESRITQLRHQVESLTRQNELLRAEAERSRTSYRLTPQPANQEECEEVVECFITGVKTTRYFAYMDNWRVSGCPEMRYFSPAGLNVISRQEMTALSHHGAGTKGQMLAVAAAEHERQKNDVLLDFIRDFEKSHFRTVSDFGANPERMNLWNFVRDRAGLPGLTLADLPAWDSMKMKYVMPPDSKLLGK